MTSSLTSRFKLAKRRVLLLSGNGATLYRFSSGQADEPLTFGADDIGVGGFAEYLRLTAPDPVYVMVDIVEEDFRLDTVPHVFGRDRSAVLKNKQTRLFRDSRYAQSVFQGRESDGRKDDRVLFSSIIRPELLEPWLAQLARLKVPVAGIYSLPLVSGQLVKHIPLNAENALLVTLQARGGLRQTFFDGGHLKVSRLAAMPRLEPRRMASYVLQEVERIRRYLNSLRLLNRNRPLQVFLLVHGSLLDDLERQAKDTVTTQFQFIEIDAIASKLKGNGLSSGDQPYGDRLFAYLLALEAPPNAYASGEETRYHTLGRAGSAMTTLGLLALVGGVGWSAIELAQGFDKQLETSTLAKQADFYEDRYVRGKERLPKLPADGNQIRRAVEMVSRIGEYRETPLDLLVVVSRALDEFPDLRIESLDWESGAEPEGAVVAPRRAPQRARRGRRVVEEPKDSGYFQMAKFRGRLEPFDGNYRLALEQISRFAEMIGEMDGIESVSILKRPLEVSSKERLAGVASLASGIGEAVFEVRVILTHL